MPAASSIAIASLVVTALGTGATAAQSRKQGKKAVRKTKREGTRRGEEQAKLNAEQTEVENKEKAKVTRDNQRRARLSQRKGAAGREGSLIPLTPTAGGGASTASKELIGV